MKVIQFAVGGMKVIQFAVGGGVFKRSVYVALWIKG